MITGEDHPLYSKVERTCEWCGDTFLAKPAKVAMGEGRFCSRGCLGAFSIRQMGHKRTSIELAIEGVLSELGISFESQKGIGSFIVDFYLPNYNLVIECDGDYWHSLPDVVERDKRKDKFLLSNGYKVEHLTETQIKNDPLQAFLSINL